MLALEETFAGILELMLRGRSGTEAPEGEDVPQPMFA